MKFKKKLKINKEYYNKKKPSNFIDNLNQPLGWSQYYEGMANAQIE